MNDRPMLIDELNKLRKSHDQSRSLILRAWPHVGPLFLLAEAFERSAEGRTCSIELTYEGIRVQVHLAKPDSFKAVVPFMLSLVDMGWIEGKGNNDGMSRDYKWEREGVKLTIWVWPHSSGACKKVEVGAQVYKQYKLVCDDELEAAHESIAG